MNILAFRNHFTLTKAFDSFFGIRPEEIKLVNIFLVYLTIVYTAYTVISTAAITLFLSKISSATLHQLLPWLYIAIAIVASVVSRIYQKFIDKFSRIKLVTWTTIFFIFSFLCLRLFLELPGDKTWLYALLMIWDETSCVVLLMVFYSFLGDYFYVHSARRVYAYITGGIALGAPLGGFGSSMLIHYISTSNLIYVGIVLHGIANIAAYIIYKTVSAPKKQSSVKKLTNPIFFKQIISNKYLWLVFLIGAFPLICACIDSYQMFYVASQTLNEKELGIFMGRFYGYVGIAYLVIDFVLAKWLLRFGVIKNLLIMPILLVIPCIGFIFYPILLFAALIKFVDSAFTNTVNTFAYQVLYLPLTDRVRMHAQAMSAGVMASGSRVIGGGILVVLSFFIIPIQFYTVIILIFVIIWIICTLLLTPMYQKILAKSLSKINIDTQDLERLLHNPNSQAVINLLLITGSKQTIIIILKSLSNHSFQKNRAAIYQLLKHDDPIIVAEAIHVIGLYDHTESSQVIAKYLFDNREKVRIAAIYAYARIENINAYHKIKQVMNLNSLSNLVMQAAVISSYLYCGVLGKKLAIEHIQCLLSKDRKTAAYIIGKTHAQEFENSLAKLLLDPDISVRKEAIRASVFFSEPSLIKNLILCLKDKRVHLLAQRTLFLLPRKAFDEIINQYQNPDLSEDKRYILLIAMSKINEERALPYIIDEITKNKSIILLTGACYALTNVYSNKCLSTSNVNELMLNYEKFCKKLIILRFAYQEMQMFPKVMKQIYADTIYFYASIISALLAIQFRLKELIQMKELLIEQDEHRVAARLELLETTVPKHIYKKFKSILFPSLIQVEFTRDIPTADTIQKLLQMDQWVQDITLYSLQLLQKEGTIIEGNYTMATKDTHYFAYIDMITFLKQVELFKEIPANFLITVAEIITKQTYLTGECIFKAGENSHSLFIVQSGLVKIQHNQKEIIQLGIGECFGELALLDSLPHVASAYSLEESQLLRIDSQDFENVLETYPEVSEALLKILARRLRSITLSFTEM